MSNPALSRSHLAGGRYDSPAERARDFLADAARNHWTGADLAVELGRAFRRCAEESVAQSNNASGTAYRAKLARQAVGR